MRPATVIVSAVGSAPAQVFVRALQAQSDVPVRVIGLDSSPKAAGLYECDRAYTVPRVRDAAFVEAIATICREEEADVLVPIADFELQTLADAAEVLQGECGVRVLTNRPEVVTLAEDKVRSAEAVAAAGVAVPECFDPAADGRLTMPLVVKPVRGAGSRDMTIVHERGALPAAIAAAGPRPLVQRYIEGSEHTVDMVIAPTGEVLAVAPRIRVEVRAGQTYKGVTVDDPDVEEAARRAVSAIGITAQANVQIIKSAHDGRCYFLECNPKFAAAMGLTIGAGLNVPLLYLKLLLGLPIARSELRRRAGMWLLRSWQDRIVAEADIQAVPEWKAARVTSQTAPSSR